MTAAQNALSFLIIDAASDDNPLSQDRCFAFRAPLSSRKNIDAQAALEGATQIALKSLEKAGFYAETLDSEHLGLDAAASLSVSSPSGQDAFKVAQKALFNRFGESLMACGPFSLNEDGEMSAAQRQSIADFLS